MGADIHETPRALIFGLGYSGRVIARALMEKGWAVTGTARDHLQMEGVTGLVFDGEVSRELRAAVEATDLLISMIGPNADGSDPVLDVLPDVSAPIMIYLSATSVYGDRGGQWVFEAQTPRPQTERGRARVEAELRWLETGGAVHILRLAGIYGPGERRNAFTKMDRAVIKEDHVVNRIHVEDIAALVVAIARHPHPGIYNVADGHPAPPQDVIAYAAKLAGAPPPQPVPWTDPSLSDMARSFYAETKRVDISRVQERFGWVPAFSTYREGLAQIWAARHAQHDT